MRRLLAITLLFTLALAVCAAHAQSRPRKLVLREKNRFAAADAVVMRVQWAPEGRQIVSASGGGEAAIWSFTGAAVAKLSGQRSPMFNAVFSPTGDVLATTGYDGTVRVWKLPGDGTFRVLNVHHAAVNDVAFCGGSDRIVTGSDEGSARLWDIRSEPKALASAAGPGTVRRVACSASRGMFANTFDSGAVQVTTFAGKVVAHFDTGQHRLNAIAFNPDGKLLLTGSTDGTVKLWSATGHPLLTIRVLEKGWVNDARFSPDGRMFVVASDDGHVRIYDVAGRLLLDEHVSAARATTATFNPDGTLLAGGSSTGEVFLYEVAHE